jgi:hypothetical protein
MTSETRTFIEAKDVVGIELSCKDCAAKITFPISKPLKMGVACPNCGAKWFDAAHDTARNKDSYPAHDSLTAIAAHLKALSEIRTDIHATLRFQIEETEE